MSNSVDTFRPDREYLRELAVLGAALGYPPRILAQLVFSGSGAALAGVLVGEARRRGSGMSAGALSLLQERAEAFALPERFLRDPEALVRFMTRAAARVLA